MEQKKLQLLLNDLKEELSGVDTDSDTSRELQQLVNKIEVQIEELEDSQQQNALTDSLQEHIVKFEVEHPRISALLNDIMIKLSSMGI